MDCIRCHQEIPDTSLYCSFCGSAQRADNQPRQLRRSIVQRRIAGVCGGLAEYLRVDVTFVRAAWVVFSIVPGALIGGLLAYLLAALIIPPASGEVAGATATRPLTRSATNRRIAGVCGGIAEYAEVDATVVRLLWTVLSVVPGAIVCGVVAYLIAWLIMPPAPATVAAPATSAA